MITLITGAPGSGKSAALVNLLADLAKNRTVYVSGIPDLQIPHEPLEDPTTWTSAVPDGSIIVIDEVQRVWRPRGPGAKVPPDIAALETHRHRGIDFYVVTQSPRLMDSNIRGLVGRHVHLRDIGILGRWWYEWPECADNCAAGWKNAPLKRRYRLPKKIFGQYKSASEHIKPVRSFPWMLIVLLAAVVLAAGFGWRTYTIIRDRGKLPASAPAATPANQPGAAPESTAVPLSTAAAYDPLAFIPRVSSKPESAPAYDHLRVVTVMPQVVGGICMGGKCRCITDQGTDPGISNEECRQYVASPPFNPYLVKPERQASPESAPAPPVTSS